MRMISSFMRCIKACRGTSSGHKIPNRVTAKTLRDTSNGNHLTVCKDIDDMFKKLSI